MCASAMIYVESLLPCCLRQTLRPSLLIPRTPPIPSGCSWGAGTARIESSKGKGHMGKSRGKQSQAAKDPVSGITLIR